MLFFFKSRFPQKNHLKRWRKKKKEESSKRHKKGKNLKESWRQRFGAREKEGKNRFDAMRRAEEK